MAVNTEEGIRAAAVHRRVPSHIVDGFVLWVTHGLKPGQFVTAVLENNLANSFLRADPTNRRAMLEIVTFVYEDLPLTCWGSKEKMKAWAEACQKEREAKEKDAKQAASTS